MLEDKVLIFTVEGYERQDFPMIKKVQKGWREVGPTPQDVEPTWEYALNIHSNRFTTIREGDKFVYIETPYTSKEKVTFSPGYYKVDKLPKGYLSRERNRSHNLKSFKDLLMDYFSLN